MSINVVLLKNCIQKLITSNLNVQQTRFYPRWAHRTPVKVLTAEQYAKREQRYTETKKDNSIQKQAVKKELKERNSISYENNAQEVVEPSAAEQYTKREQRYIETKKDNSIQIQAVKKELKERNSNSYENSAQEVVEPSATDTNESDREQIAYKIDFQQAKRVNLRVPNVSKQKPTVDMLETVIDKDGNYIYTKMENRDLRITKIFMSVKSKKCKDLMLLEGKRLIQEGLIANCKLEYLLFSRKTDLDSLKEYLPTTGCKLYKMPYKELQMWSDLNTSPGVMGIFKIPNPRQQSLENSIPLTVICDNVREPGNLGAILRASAAVGCKKVILTKGCTYLWDTKVLRTACGSHFQLCIEPKLDWDNIQDSIDKNAEIFIADNNVITQDMTSPNTTSNLEELVSSLPLVPYYSINYNDYSDIVVIIGGESEGISTNAYNFAMNRQGARINIPLSNKVDSLNTGTALGIISFEIKRQFMGKKRNVDL